MNNKEEMLKLVDAKTLNKYNILFEKNLIEEKYSTDNQKLINVNMDSYSLAKEKAKKAGVSTLVYSGQVFDYGMSLLELREEYEKKGELEKFESLISVLLYNLKAK